MAKTNKHSINWRVSRIEQLFRRSGLFLWSMKSIDANTLVISSSDHWRGSANKGAQIMAYDPILYAQRNDFDDFEWLRDLRAFGGSEARSLARRLIDLWTIKNNRWSINSWQPSTMAKRLTNLVLCFDWYGNSADKNFKEKTTKMVQLQARCLAIDWGRLNDVEDRVSALKGLIICESGLGASTTDLNSLMEFLVPIVNSIINEDGGHKSRMPDKHLAVMRDLIEIRNTGLARQLNQLSWLTATIAKMTAICRMWRHADGQFARFNGAGLVNPEIIEETLARGGQKGKLLQKAPHTGFMRLTSGRSTVIIDVGQPTQNALITGLSTLAFEFAVGQNLLVINPGQNSTDKKFQSLLCDTQAHSTLTIDGQNSSNFESERIARVSDAELGPAKDGLLATASHDGYEKSHGIIHRRRLYLSSSGGNLRGADQLEYTGAPGEIARNALVRFHLHPRVTAAVLRDQRILIKIRGSRIGWMFKANASVSIDQSLFLDINGRMNCQQIVLKVPVSNLRSFGKIEVKWAFKRNE